MVTPNQPIALCHHNLETGPKWQNLPETSCDYSCSVLSLSPAGLSAMVIPLIKQGDKTPLLNLEPSSGAVRGAGLAGCRLSKSFLLLSPFFCMAFKVSERGTKILCCLWGIKVCIQMCLFRVGEELGMCIGNESWALLELCFISKLENSKSWDKLGS